MPWDSFHTGPAIADDKSLPLNSSAACGVILYLEENTMSQRNSAHAQDHTDVPSDPALRVKALESLLVEKGLVDPAALDVLVDTYENKVGPRNGAQVVARAWVDPACKQLSNACLMTTQRRSQSSAFPASRVRSSPSWRIRPRFTTSSSVPCIRAILGRCWACRPPG
jgi:Nitrile hydratase, alpha chain